MHQKESYGYSRSIRKNEESNTINKKDSYETHNEKNEYEIPNKKEKYTSQFNDKDFEEPQSNIGKTLLSHATKEKQTMENVKTLKRLESPIQLEDLRKEPMTDTRNSLELDNNDFGEYMKERNTPQGKIKEMFSNFREEMHKEMSNMHLEILRQFQIQIVIILYILGRNTGIVRTIWFL